MTIPITKIYIDSRQKKTQYSASHTDFSVELPFNINLPTNSKTGFLYNICNKSYSFYTIEARRHDIIYFIIIANSEFEDNLMCAKRIPEGNYSLVTLNNAIANIMNT